LAGLDVSEVDADPVAQFLRWLQDAAAAELREPNAFTLATADGSGRPRARTVLLKAADAAGFTFFTSYHSIKGEHLASNPQASMCFAWIELERQVIVSGAVERTTADETASYFRSRPHGSQLGALASQQSRVLESRQILTDRYSELSEQYPEGSEVPVPEYWGGFRLMPEDVEFWQGRPNRLHDRVRYRRLAHAGGASDEWAIERLSP